MKNRIDFTTVHEVGAVGETMPEPPPLAQSITGFLCSRGEKEASILLHINNHDDKHYTYSIQCSDAAMLAGQIVSLLSLLGKSKALDLVDMIRQQVEETHRPKDWES